MHFFSQGQLRQVQARKKVAKTVLAFVLVFAVCFLPSHVFMLWFHNNPKSQDEYNTFWHVLRIVGFCLSFTNSCINPIALYLVSGTFRKHFDEHLFWRCSISPSMTPTDSNVFLVKNNGTALGQGDVKMTESITLPSLQSVTNKNKSNVTFVTLASCSSKNVVTATSTNRWDPDRLSPLKISHNPPLNVINSVKQPT